MKLTRFFLPLAGLLALSFPVQAQDEAANRASDSVLDPARLAAASQTVDHLFPLGTYERMMKGTMDQMMDAMLSSMGGMSMGDIAGVAGSSEEMTEEEKAQTFGEAMREKDPHFEERMRISTKVMGDEMIGLMASMEPEVRTALTKIYARKYTAGQLSEMNRFFATETGTAFARDYMMVFVDPEMMQSMMNLTPKMMRAMPEIQKKVEEATAHLPAPPKSDFERAMDAVGEAAEAAAEAVACDVDDEECQEADAEPWTNPENWSEADQEMVNKLSIVSDEAFEEYYAAVAAATENAKKRMGDEN